MDATSEAEVTHVSARSDGQSVRVQRLRVRYRVAASAASLTHRQVMAVWEEAARGAGLSLAYSQARRATPQLSIAAPLPLGVTSDCELVDLYLAELMEPVQALARLARALPPGIEAAAAWEVGLTAPSLQSQLCWAEYEARVSSAGLPPARVQARIDAFLAADSFPWEHRRETKVRRYDLRPLVLAAKLAAAEDGCLLLTLRLRAEQEMTARADQVVAALGLPPPLSIHRRRLYLLETQPAILAYRRLGRPDL